TLYYPYRIGGAEVSVQILAEELVAKGNNVTVVSLSEGVKQERDNIGGVKIIKLPIKNLYWPFNQKKQSKFTRLLWHIIDIYNPAYIKTVKDIFTETEPDVVHTNNLSGFSTSVWAVAKKNKIKVVHTARDYYLMHPNCTLFKNNENMNVKSLNVKAWSFFKKKKSAKIDVFIGISEFITNLHKNNGFFKESLCTTIYNPVVVNAIKQGESAQLTNKRVGFIGRLSEEKGFLEYCELAKNNQNYTFFAAGNYISEKEKERLSKFSNDANVNVLGYVPVEKFFDMVDIVILPIKWNEPFGRVVVESVLAGKLVISRKVGSIPELSQILPNIRLVDSLIDEFDDVVNSVVISEVSEDVKKMFSPDNVANKYISAYKM
ncbi:TPA: glycosyltransferase, partial [Klebsiella variicola]|nr:glycosyltransferase [Klebsiella variicola]